MNPPENTFMQAFFVLVFALCTAYAAGRMHQWYKQGFERDQAWRSGYDSATRSLFQLATRSRRELAKATAAPEAPARAGASIRGTASVGPRHALPRGHAAIAPAARDSAENTPRPATLLDATAHAE